MPVNDRWMWCARCQRCYTRAEVQHGSRGTRNECPYQCGGSVLIDGFQWEEVRFLAPGVIYPKEPERGREYPVPEEYLDYLVA
jgi:hypothetical protein